MEEKETPNQPNDLFDKHNVLSRFAGLAMVVAFLATFYVGLFTDKVIQHDLVAYSSVGMMIVFGGVSLISNNMDKILDIIKSFRR